MQQYRLWCSFCSLSLIFFHSNLSYFAPQEVENKLEEVEQEKEKLESTLESEKSAKTELELKIQVNALNAFLITFFAWLVTKFYVPNYGIGSL